MGLINTILYFSREDIYTDDTFDSDTLAIEYKPSNENDNESTLSTSSSCTDWINFNNSKMYTDNGMDILA